CETAVPWAVVFPEDSLCETPSVPLHPLQVYDALLPLGVLVILLVVDRRGGEAARPFLLPLMVGLYALARFGTGLPRPRAGGRVGGVAAPRRVAGPGGGGGGGGGVGLGAGGGGRLAGGGPRRGLPVMTAPHHARVQQQFDRQAAHYSAGSAMADRAVLDAV